MFPVIHGILAQAQEGESCFYPLDVKPELINLLGYEAFNVHDKCGHNLSSSGKGSHAAISQSAAEAMLSGGQIPEEHILPPSYLGEGVYAVEYLLDVTNIEDKDGLFVIAAGGYRPLTPEHGGGNCNVVLISENSVVVMQVSAVTHDQRSVNRNFIGRTSVRLGIYYNTVNKQVGFNIDGEDVGYLGEYTHDEPFILMAAKQAWMAPEYNLSADVSIEVLTKGKDLQLAYPEGTLGLDGIEAPTVSEGDLDAAANLLNDARDAVDNAEQKLADAIADGKVEQSEIDALEDAITDAQAKLDAAKDAINALPDGSAKDGLVTEANTEQGRLNAIEVPDVDEGAFDDAADLLADAKAAIDVAEQKLADAIADGRVEQSEVDALEDAIAEAQNKLDDAETAINDLPAGAAKDDLIAELGAEQSRLDGIEVPAVDDKDPVTHTYPLDATHEQLQELGAERFILNDDAGHHLSLSNVTNSDFYAVSSAVADAYINGTPIPLEQSIVSVGEIVAVEFMVELVADISSESDLVMLSVGALGEQSGASLACWIQYLSGEPSYNLIINTVHGDGGENLPLTDFAEWGGDISFRVGLCFDFSAHEVHCIIDGENFGSYEIGEDAAISLEVSAVCWEGAVIHSADIRTFVNGRDLQFDYPLGAVGLDGKPAGG